MAFKQQSCSFSVPWEGRFAPIPSYGDDGLWPIDLSTMIVAFSQENSKLRALHVPFMIVNHVSKEYSHAEK